MTCLHCLQHSLFVHLFNLYDMFKGTMIKWPVQKLTQGTTQKHLQHHDATDI